MVEREHSREIILSSSLILLLFCLCLTAAFPTMPRREIKRRDKRCIHCGLRNRKLESHHLCHEAVAKEFGIPYELYSHITNGAALCGDCHDKYHKDHDHLTILEKRDMVIEMLERIIDFHEGNNDWYVGRLHKINVLQQHPEWLRAHAYTHLHRVKKEEKQQSKKRKQRYKNEHSYRRAA